MLYYLFFQFCWTVTLGVLIWFLLGLSCNGSEPLVYLGFDGLRVNFGDCLVVYIGVWCIVACVYFAISN